MNQNLNDSRVERIGGYLHKVVPIVDNTGNVISHAVAPFMVELRPRDMLQIIVGASLLAIPVSFTEEVWRLGEELPNLNVIGLGIYSFLIISL